MKRETLVNVVKYGVAALAIVLVTPLIFILVQGLLGLAVAAVVGLGIVNFAPVLANTFANWKLKAIKWESGTNPIETMQNVYREKHAALAEFLQKITVFATEVMNFKDKLEEFQHQFPQDAAKFQETLTTMERLLAFRRQKYKESQEALALFDAEISKANAIWKMGLAAASMRKAAGMTEDDFMQKIKTETAIESVQTTLNAAIADLESSLLEEVSEQQMLSYSPAAPVTMRIPKQVEYTK